MRITSAFLLSLAPWLAASCTTGASDGDEALAGHVQTRDSGAQYAPLDGGDSAHDAGSAHPSSDSGQAPNPPLGEDSGQSHVEDGGSRDDSGADEGDEPDAGDAGSTSPVNASPGCGKSGRPASGRVSVPGSHNYRFPPSYDGSQPFPLLIGFHAASNPIEQIENLTNGSELEYAYVRAFPKSKGSAWNYDTDIAKVLAMYDDLVANYCIDMDRVFATGHSSGAQLIVQILTPGRKAHADHLNFRAVAPVAASRYGSVSGPIPVMYIQAQHDTVRNSSGSDVVQEFVKANGCAMTSKPHPFGPTCTSSGKPVNNGCVMYDGCVADTVWCSHNDPQYANTFHGWPCFATGAMAEFFKTFW